MNEFISNSGTLINPDSVYDQERFINILQIILQKKTQKELSEQTGLNNATISRISTVPDLEDHIKALLIKLQKPLMIQNLSKNYMMQRDILLRKYRNGKR